MESTHPASGFRQMIVHEDKALLAINKPSGIPSQGDSSGDTDLRTLALRYLSQRSKSRKSPFCGLIHRLDRPTSGLILFAKTPKVLTRMNAAFKEREVQKTYLCISDTKAKHPMGLLEHHLYKDAKINKTFVKKASGNSKFASLTYELLGEGVPGFLYLVRPMTGRSHQIRVQMAYIGCPLIGDRKYGGSMSSAKDGFGLHAHQLDFDHPLSGQNTTIRSDPPSNELWRPFHSLLSDL